MKKFLSFLLTFVMLFSLAMPALAADNTSKDVTATYTPSSTEDTTKIIYFDNTGSWNTVYAFVWNDSGEYSPWPGTAMTLVNSESSIYSIEVPTADASVIFNNGGGTSTVDQTIPTDGKNLYTYSTGEWTVYGQGSTEDTTATITGVTITVDGTTYDSTNTSAENPATITPKTTSIIITVTGTNLNNGTMDNVVGYAPGSSIDVSTGHLWDFEDDGSGATIDISQSLIDFISATTAFEIAYCDDFLTDATWTGSGVYVVYDSGSTEDTTTLPNPLYFKAEAATSVEVATYNSNGSLTTNADNQDTFTMTAVAGETGIFSVDTANFSAETAKVAFAGPGLDPMNPIDLPTDGSNMYDYDKSEWTTYTPSSTEDTTATITGVSITVDGTTYTSGTATITPNTQSIILTVTGKNLQNGTGDNVILIAPETGLALSDWFTVGSDGMSATADLKNQVLLDALATTAFELKYSNDFLTTQTLTGSGVYVIYQSETVSVDITWGAMSFTYDDTVAEGATEETGWTCADGANKVTVTNNGTVNVNAAVAYTPADGYSAITGEFQNVNEAAVTNADIDASNSYDFYLILSGKPETALDGATIGSVTVTITKATTSE